jgi:BMFP domain-containing protein YqiC
MEKNFRAILQSVLGKLDLVTREEFEVQKAVLIKTRHKLEAMETLVTELESKIKAP